jgi:hypothetical protein
MTINYSKLLNALRYQNKTLTMNDNLNRLFGTDFMHWSIVRKVKQLNNGKQVLVSDLEQWLKHNA